MNNNHTNILLMNIPFRYDIINVSYVNKTHSTIEQKVTEISKN